MVQAMSLEEVDYLIPLGTIRDVLLDPDEQSRLTPAKAQDLLGYHLEKLKSPSHSFGSPSPGSRQEVSCRNAKVPGTSVEVTVGEQERQVAYKLSDGARINEIEALLLIKRAGQEDVDIDRATIWYGEEVIAVCRIVQALQRLSRRDDGDWTQMAINIINELMPDDGKWIEKTFRSWAELTQKQISGNQRGEALFWSRFQLRLQNELLDLIFMVLYDNPERPAGISQGLIGGIIASAFGTAQANREIWNSDYESQRYMQRVRDLTLVIALESLCLSNIVTPFSDDDEPPARQTLLKDRDGIISLHLLMSEQSADLAYQEGQSEPTEFPIWPMPVICLAWSIVLRSLPTDLQPPSQGYDQPLYGEFATRAMRISSGLFPWLEDVLVGPLFGSESGYDDDKVTTELATWRRKVIKDLLLGLSDLLTFNSIADKTGLYRIWSLLFGQGSPKTSYALCEDYWTADSRYADRCAILANAQFPHNAVRLPEILASLSGARPRNPTSRSDSDFSPSNSALQYLVKLPSITCNIDASLCRVEVDAEDRHTGVVEAKKDIILPGGCLISQGTKGTVISPSNEPQVVIMWEGSFQVVGLLVEMLQVYSGCRRADHRAEYSPAAADFVHLSISDLAIGGDPMENLMACLELLRVMLQPALNLINPILSYIYSGGQKPGVHVLDMCLALLRQLQTAEATPQNTKLSSSAIDIVQSLLFHPDPAIWDALHQSSFFGTEGKRRSMAENIIEVDAVKGNHDLSLAVLRLVAGLVESTASVVKPDSTVVRAALKLVVSSIWTPSLGWRYRDIAKKYEIVSLLCAIFTITLQHPTQHDAARLTGPAEYLIETFITSSSLLTYRPLLETLVQAPFLASKLLTAYRVHDARVVVHALESSLSFVSALLRISTIANSSTSGLPKSILTAPIVYPTGEKLQVIDSLFDLVANKYLPTSTRLSSIRLLHTFLESTQSDHCSLAGSLRDAKTSFQCFPSLLKEGDSATRQVVWDFLATVLTTQPGCANFCTGVKGEKVGGILATAVERILNWQDSISNFPQLIASALAYCNAIINSLGTAKAHTALRSDKAFWESVHQISVRIVPAPPTFTLSMHSDQFANRIQSYAYAVQAKANAIALLAEELNVENEGGETTAQSLILSLFRNNTSLSELALSAQHNSCLPDLHETQNQVLASTGVHSQALRTVLLSSEREYGSTYLYDGDIRVPGDETEQSRVNLALDMLNLNWSMLEADLNLTKSFRFLAEVAFTWTEDDHLAAAACLKAGVAIATVLAEEQRGGDVMLTIQYERLNVLAKLLDTALSGNVQPDQDVLSHLVGDIRKILESQDFPPTISLRHPDLPPIHQPLLRIVHLIVPALPALQQNPVLVGPIIDVFTGFTLDVADVVFDSIVRNPSPSFSSSTADLEQISSTLCEITRTPFTKVWLNKITEHNSIPRSLEIISRSRVTKEQIPPHIASILLIHLALASNPLSAEKLAVSGVLPTYSDNAITTLAEQGKIIPSSSLPEVISVHGGWCGMLYVIQALLTSLSVDDAGRFARSDIIPFVNVCRAQILQVLEWDEEEPLSGPRLNELVLITDMIHGIVRVVGPNRTLFNDMSTPSLVFLKSIRYALSHPLSLASSMTPANEEERREMETELSKVEGSNDPKPLDFQNAPTIAGRVARLLGAARSIVMALVILTRSWETVRAESEDINNDFVLYLDDEALVSTDDPAGILNDIVNQITTSLGQLPLSSVEQDVINARSILKQLQESTALLSLSQLIARLANTSDQRGPYGMDDSKMDMDHIGDIKFSAVGRRVSLAKMGDADRAFHLLGEMFRDLRSILSGFEDTQGMMGWLWNIAEKRTLST